MRVLLLRAEFWKFRNHVKRELRDSKGRRGLCAIITDHEYRRYRPLVRNFSDFLYQVRCLNSHSIHKPVYKINREVMSELSSEDFRVRAWDWVHRRSTYVFPRTEENIKHRERLFELFCQNEILNAKRGVK